MIINTQSRKEWTEPTASAAAAVAAHYRGCSGGPHGDAWHRCSIDEFGYVYSDWGGNVRTRWNGYGELEVQQLR